MIYTLTINPAIDKLIFVDKLIKDRTNRIKNTFSTIGGKGAHVSINLSILNCNSRAYGISFGKNGQIIRNILRQYPQIDERFLYYDRGNSRTNYVIIEDNNKCTLITEKGELISKSICNKLIKQLEEDISFGDFLVLSGDASNTEIPYIYSTIMERLSCKNIKVFLDASSDDLIEGIKKKPFLVKPNIHELMQFSGHLIETQEDVLKAIEKISSLGVECVVVSLGKKGSIVKYQDIIYKVHSLKVDVVNTVGCGDALLSGFIFGFDKGLCFEDTLRLATAISALTAKSKSTVGFDYKDIDNIKNKVIIEKIY